MPEIHYLIELSSLDGLQEETTLVTWKVVFDKEVISVLRGDLKGSAGRGLSCSVIDLHLEFVDISSPPSILFNFWEVDKYGIQTSGAKSQLTCLWIFDSVLIV